MAQHCVMHCCMVNHDQNVGAKGCYDYVALTKCLLWVVQ
jgi:hypothetical protein